MPKSAPTALQLQSLHSTIPIVDTLPPQSQQERKKPNILLVEDNAVNQRVLRKQLERGGYIVHTANNGVEALSVLATTNTSQQKKSDGIEVNVVLCVDFRSVLPYSTNETDSPKDGLGDADYERYYLRLNNSPAGSGRWPEHTCAYHCNNGVCEGGAIEEGVSCWHGK